MPTPERRALLLLLALAVAGQGVRYLVTKPGEPAGGVQLLAALGAESPLAQRDSAMRQGRPLAQDEHINVDLAPAGELARLPKVGPRLAKTIVADRQARGPFGSLDGLDRVAGIGPGLLKTIGPHLRSPASLPGGLMPCPARVISTRRAGGLATARPSPPQLPPPSQTWRPCPASAPPRQPAILQYREQHGPFAAVEDV